MVSRASAHTHCQVAPVHSRPNKATAALNCSRRVLHIPEMSVCSSGSASGALYSQMSTFVLRCEGKFGLQTLQDSPARHISVGSCLESCVVLKRWRAERATDQIGQVRQQNQQQSPAAADTTTAAALAAVHAMPWHANAPNSPCAPLVPPSSGLHKQPVTLCCGVLPPDPRCYTRCFLLLTAAVHR